MLTKTDIKLSHMLLKPFICSLLIALLLASCSPTAKHRGNSYTVVPGDTLFSIATRHGTTVAALSQTNRLSSSTIEPGQVILIPPVSKPNTQQLPASVIKNAQGLASWYGPGFHGRKTASGERFNMYQLTAAHRTLPFGSQVRVTRLDSGQSVLVRINDRGPHVYSRIIDLSYQAARSINLIGPGSAPVRIEVVSVP